MANKDPEKRKAANKKYREKNREKILEKAKEYRENNREAISERNKEYYEKNRERERERTKEYYEKNKEAISEKAKKYNKEYSQTESGKKTNRISNWKQMGVISEDFKSLYNFYINCENCEECKVQLTEDKVRTQTSRCLDHNHKTGQFRNVLCNSCNVKRRY